MLQIDWKTGLTLFCLGGAFGCNQRELPPTFPVRGSVTLDQQPLSGGMITFSSPETGDLQALPIESGKYAGEVRAGKRRVEIQAYPPRKGPVGPMDPPPANYISSQYNSATTLHAEVTPQGPNVFDFELQTDP